MLGCFWVSAPCYLLELFDAVIALKINSWNICSALLSSSNANTTQSQNGVPLFTAQTGCLILSQLDPFTNKLFFWVASLVFEEPTNYYIIIFFFSPSFSSEYFCEGRSSAMSFILVGTRRKVKDTCWTPSARSQFTKNSQEFVLTDPVSANLNMRGKTLKWSLLLICATDIIAVISDISPIYLIDIG